MNIRELVFNIQTVYDEMAETFSKFQKDSGLPCLPDCGQCCTNPEIEASLFEMLPWALKVYDEGTSDLWLEKLENPHQNFCLLLNKSHKCLSYSERPAVCRMFGVAGYKDKYGKSTLALCKVIRENNPNSPLPTDAPVMSQWFNRISNLGDPSLHKKLPINEAMRSALVKIMFYFQYHS